MAFNSIMNNNMNNIIRKCTIILGIFIASIPCFTNASLDLIDTVELVGYQSDKSYINNNADIICIIGSNSCAAKVMFNRDHGNYAWFYYTDGHSIGDGNMGYCGFSHTLYYTVTDTNSNCKTYIKSYKINEYTSLECQTEYSLIPVNDVTANYCKINFDLIDPADCPISEGTGAINWSSLFINNTQYPGNSEISVFIPDFIGWNITYNSGANLIEIEGYNADTSYIEEKIANETLTPTSEDFSALIEGLAGYIPLIAVAGLMIRAARIFKKVF